MRQMPSCSASYAAWIEAEYLRHLENEWITVKQRRAELESSARPTPRQRCRAKRAQDSTADVTRQLRQIAQLRASFDKKLTYWAFHQNCKTLNAGTNFIEFIDFCQKNSNSRPWIMLGGERMSPFPGAEHPPLSILRRLGFTLTLKWLVCGDRKFNRFTLKRIHFSFEDACRNLPVGAHVDQQAGHIVLRIRGDGYPVQLDKERSLLHRFYRSGESLQGLDSDDDMPECVITGNHVPSSRVDVSGSRVEDGSAADQEFQIHATLTKHVAPFVIRTCVQALFHNKYRLGSYFPQDVYTRIWAFVDPVYDVIGNAQHLTAHFARAQAERKKQEQENRRLAEAAAREAERLRRERVPEKSKIAVLLHEHFIFYARHNAGGSGRHSLWCVIRVCESASWGKFFAREGKAPPTKYFLNCEFDAFDNQNAHGWENKSIGLLEGYLHPSELSSILQDQMFPKLRAQGFHVHGHIQRNYDSDEECESESSYDMQRKRRRKTRTKAKPDLRWRLRIRLGWAQKLLNTTSGYGHGFDVAWLRGDIELIL